MATAESVIELIFKGVDQTGAAFDSVLKNTGNLAGNIETATQPIADLTVGALKLEAGLLAAGAAVTLFSVKVAGDFDSAFREISTLITAPTEDVEAFRQAILGYAETSGKPLEELTQAIYDSISAGVDYADSINVVAAAEKLAVAGRGELDTTTKLLLQTMNAYGASTTEITHYSDVFFGLVKSGITTIPELGASFANVAGSAAQLGIPIETLGAALATLTSTSAPNTAAAVTQLNAVLTAFLKPSSEAKALAAELNIEFGLQLLQANGLEGALKILAAATGGNASQMAVFVGSAEAARAVLPLVGTAADKFAENLEYLQNVTGATEIAFTKMAEAIDYKARQVQNAFQVFLTAFGTPLLDEFGGIAEAVRQIFFALADSVDSDALAEIVDYIEEKMQTLAAVLKSVANNLPEALKSADLSGFTGGLDAIAEAFSNLFNGYDVSTVEGLARGLEMIGGAFLNLSKFTGGVLESFGPALEALGGIGKSLAEIDPATFEKLGNMFGVITQVNISASGIEQFTNAASALLGVIVLNQGANLVLAMRTLAVPMAATATAALGAYAAYVLATEGVDGLREKTAIVGEVVFNFGERLLGMVNGAEGAGGSLGELGESAETTAIKMTPLPAKLTAIGQAAEGAGGSLGAIGKEAAISATNIDGLLVSQNLLIRDSSAIGEITREYERMRAATELSAIATSENAKSMGEQKSAAAELSRYIDGLLIPTDDLKRSTEDWSKITTGIIPVYNEVNGKLAGYEMGVIAAGSANERANKEILKSIGHINILGKSTGAAATEAEKAAAAQQKWNEKMAELENELAIEAIRSNTEIAVAEIEAGVARVQAAYDSINVTIGSTADIISQSLDLLASSDTSLSAKFDIERQLDLENRRRDEALALQKELTEAEIDYINTKTKALERGDALVTIQGDGLKPHLEAFMWEILGAIQTRVNAEGHETLLGI